VTGPGELLLLVLKGALVWVVAALPLVSLVLLLEAAFWLGDRLGERGRRIVLVAGLAMLWLALVWLTG